MDLWSLGGEQLILAELGSRVERGGWQRLVAFQGVGTVCINQERLGRTSCASQDHVSNLLDCEARVHLAGQMFGQNRKCCWFNRLPEYDSEREEDTYQALDMEPVPVGGWRILSSFLQRNWFRRVWTVQEFGLFPKSHYPLRRTYAFLGGTSSIDAASGVRSGPVCRHS